VKASEQEKIRHPALALRLTKARSRAASSFKDTKHARAASSQQSARAPASSNASFARSDFRFYLKDHYFKIIYAEAIDHYIAGNWSPQRNLKG
jgi:hypothetical protein